MTLFIGSCNKPFHDRERASVQRTEDLRAALFNYQWSHAIQRLHLHRGDGTDQSAHLPGSEFNVDGRQHKVHVVGRDRGFGVRPSLERGLAWGYDLYLSGHVTTTSATVKGLPINGKKIYARLYSIVGGVTYYNDYTYTAASLATLKYPAPGSTLKSTSVFFEWTAGAVSRRTICT